MHQSDIPEAIRAVQDLLRGHPLTLEDTLEWFHREHGIRGKTDGQLVILDYNQITVNWSEPFGHVCRGLILDAKTFDVIAFGLPKFFNLGESQADEIDWSTAVVQEKLDGSMVQRFFNPHTDRFEYSTRFQLPRDIAVNECKPGITWEEVIGRCMNNVLADYIQPENVTLVLEAMSPANRIVVRHTAFHAKVLAVRNIETLEELPVGGFPGPTPKTFAFASAEETAAFADTLSGATQEGFVVVDSAFRRLKIKGHQYVQLHRMKEGTEGDRALINLARSRDYEEVTTHFPEIKPRIEIAVGIIEDLITRHQAALEEFLSKAPTQKDFAGLVQASGLEAPSVLFLVKAGKSSSVRSAFNEMRENAFVDLVKAKMPPEF